MSEIIRELAKIYLYLFAILGVLFLGYVLVEGQAYQAAALLAFVVGLGFWKGLSE